MHHKFNVTPLRRAQELVELPSAFPTCKIGDRTAAESERLIKRMGFVDVQCCMVCMEERQCGRGGTAIERRSAGDSWQSGIFLLGATTRIDLD